MSRRKTTRFLLLSDSEVEARKCDRYGWAINSDCRG